MQRFPQIFALMVVFAEKACNSFCTFRGKRLFMGEGQWLGSSACRGFYLDCSNFLREFCEEWVQTRGYLALRILHADTPTRLFSGSAHFLQTSLKKLRELQINPKTPS